LLGGSEITADNEWVLAHPAVDYAAIGEGEQTFCPSIEPACRENPTMSNLAVALKDEIRRLARKEIRAQVSTTKRAAAQHRREIAQLKRLFKQQEKKLQSLASLGQQSSGEPHLSDDAMESVRFSARSVRAQRNRLGLSAEDYGKLLGVSGQTIYHWEQGKSRPRRSQMAGLVAVRGLGRRNALARLEALNSQKTRGTSKPRRPVHKPR
jgi:DNA-binding transcriptional regulator YiaG